MPITITIKRDGPYRIEGDLSEITLIGHDGQPISLEGKKGVSLCRCGGSSNKPFCDGTHSKIGFEGARAAVQEADGG